MKLLIDYALQLVGLPYRWGGDDTIEGFDCSGLAQELLASVGFDPPGDQTAEGLRQHFMEHGRPLNMPQVGALVFYGKEKATHVAFCVDFFRIIEAGGGGSKTISEKAAADQNAYVRIRPWNHRKDILGIYMPDYKSVGI